MPPRCRCWLSRRWPPSWPTSQQRARGAAHAVHRRAKGEPRPADAVCRRPRADSRALAGVGAARRRARPHYPGAVTVRGCRAGAGIPSVPREGVQSADSPTASRASACRRRSRANDQPQGDAPSAAREKRSTRTRTGWAAGIGTVRSARPRRAGAGPARRCHPRLAARRLHDGVDRPLLPVTVTAQPSGGSVRSGQGHAYREAAPGAALPVGGPGLPVPRPVGRRPATSSPARMSPRTSSGPAREGGPDEG